MMTTRLGVLALAVLGIKIGIDGVIGFNGVLGLIMTPDRPQVLLSFALGKLVAGLVLVRFRVGLAERLFGAEDTEIGRMSVWDVHVVGLALLGVWIIVEHLPDLTLLAGAASWPGASWPAALQFGLSHVLGVVLGVFLVLRGEIVARLWCAEPDRADSVSGGDPGWCPRPRIPGPTRRPAH